jgi:hypothetical protein
MKYPQDENARIKRIVANLILEIDVLKKVLEILIVGLPTEGS